MAEKKGTKPAATKTTRKNAVESRPSTRAAARPAVVEDAAPEVGLARPAASPRVGAQAPRDTKGEHTYQLVKEAGPHRHDDGRTYVAGDELTTSKPMDKLFAGKWVRLTGVKRAGASAPSAAETVRQRTGNPDRFFDDHESPQKRGAADAEIEREEEEEEEVETETGDEEGFGEDVTEKFEGAEKAQVRVFHKGRKYTIVDSDAQDKALNDQDITTQEKVDEFIAELDK